MTSQTHPSRPGPRTTASTTAPDAASPRATRRLGRIVAGSLVTGTMAGAVLATAPLLPGHEEGVTGGLLLGFAAGWAMLVVLSTRYTSAPQRWATAPAAFLTLGALALLAFGPSARPAVDWAWPPAALLLAAWTAPHVRRLPSRAGRRLLAPVVVTLAVASIGAGYQTIASAVDSRTASMPGQMVDVGGHRLHLTCTGSGSPTVVLEPGAGEMAASLGWITPAVARTTRVCAYDRPGRGGSDPTDTPQNGARVAGDLHTALHRAGVPGPYVLAGHSFGGLYVLAFAARYPDEVAGMVLIDSTAPMAGTAAGTAAGSDYSVGPVLRRASVLLSTMSRLGIGRLYADHAFGDLPPQSRADVRAGVATTTTLRSTIDEYLAGSASMQDAAALTDFGDKPLVVLTAGAGHPDSWFTSQDHLATLSTHAVHRVVHGATHEDLVADARYAAVSARAITDLVTSVRAGR
ncbi:alpha/beta hydrolase [Kineosporia sp. A_224]|uniref:alpha/beta hydrolase n=1 Tax=Kineosporia sp. A_224 TaxID=1962180 RepID=UPI000B4A5D1D|nr:alpha/beta hydrolase [Kineosporia sp. A_224]